MQRTKVASESMKSELTAWKISQKDTPFPRREFQERLARLKAAMRSNNLDIIFLSSPESMYYISGYKNEWYQAQSSTEWPPASGIAVHVDHPGLILFETEEEYLLAHYTSIVEDIRGFFEDEESGSRMTNWIARELKGEGWLPGRVGLEMWSYRPNRPVSEAFQKELEKRKCVVVDCSRIVRGLRKVKSPLEIECIEKAAKIGEIGIRACMESMKPGVTELEVWGSMMAAMACAGGENPSITLPVSSGPRSALLHALATRRKIRKGDLVITDLCGVYNRYHANYARTFSVGRPSTAIRKGVHLAAGAFEVLEDLIEPNLPVETLIKTMKEYYAKVGIEKRRWWWGGYELGIAFPPDWVGEFVFDPTVDPRGERFVPGMVVNYESNFYLPDNAGMAVLIDTMIFKKSGARILGSNIPFDVIEV